MVKLKYGVKQDDKFTTFACAICGREFSARDAKTSSRFMNIHVQKTHGETPKRGGIIQETNAEAFQNLGFNMSSNVKIVRI